MGRECLKREPYIFKWFNNNCPVDGHLYIGIYEMTYIRSDNIMEYVVEVRSGLYFLKYGFVGDILTGQCPSPQISSQKGLFRYNKVRSIKRISIMDLPLYVGWLWKSERYMELIRSGD